MAEEMPPPYKPPLAVKADPKLVAFMYFIARDMLPVGYIETTVARALKETPVANPELLAFADRIARTLTYDASQALTQLDAVGTIPPPDPS